MFWKREIAQADNIMEAKAKIFVCKKWTHLIIYVSMYVEIEIVCKSKYVYRISSNNVRGYYSFLNLKGAATNWGRPLIKGSYYFYFLNLLSKVLVFTLQNVLKSCKKGPNMHF